MTLARNGPTSVPGSISSGRIANGKSSAEQISDDQSPVRGSSNWVVDASVRSPSRRPVKSQAKRSGIISIVSATSRIGDWLDPHREELIDGVEGQELQPGDLIDPLARDLLSRELGHAVGSCVPVVDGVSEQRVTPADEPEIDAPGIDADAVEVSPGSRRGLLDGGLHLLEESGDVPVECIHHPDRAVGKSVDLVEREGLAVEPTEYPPAALGAEVEGEVVAGVSHGAEPEGSEEV